MKWGAKHVAWAYLLRKGTVVDNSEGIEWNTYGSYYEFGDYPKKLTGKRIKELEKESAFIKANALKWAAEGLVDWKKTEAPRSKTESTFEGTYAENGKLEVLAGTIYFTNGRQAYVYTEESIGDTVFDVVAFMMSLDKDNPFNENPK